MYCMDSHMKMIFNCVLSDVECVALSWLGSDGHFNRVIILYHNNADIVNIVNIVVQYCQYCATILRVV